MPEQPVKNSAGAVEYEVDSLQQFIGTIKNLKGPKGWKIYRGQSNISWSIVPSAGRPPHFLNTLAGAEHIDIWYFNAWLQTAVAFRASLPENRLHALAVAQHHGLVTRLLDWTFNPLVALFFALHVDNGDDDGAVYAASFNGTLRIEEGLGSFLTKELRDHPEGRVFRCAVPVIDERMLAQDGTFTFHTLPNVPMQTADGIEACVRIPSCFKTEIKKDLTEISINDRSLFPGLDGLSKNINWEWKTYEFHP